MPSVHVQVKKQKPAWTFAERAPMSAEGTIFTSHWLVAPGSQLTSNVTDLIAKVIRLDSSIDPAVLDKKRIIYELE